MKIDPGIWPSLSALLDEYLDQAEGSRAAWLDGLGPEYAELVPMLRELVAKGAARNDRFLGTLPAVTGRTAVTDYAPVAARSVVGPYRLIRELGHGGMGIVWLAERADGLLKRKVALKLPIVVLNNDTLAERFARERDILADLTHPQIARLYDAGITASGQPYLALEYVEGEPITRHCDHHGLDLRTRLELFLSVLRAVEYAHHHGIVHRDLKPSNILVTGEGEVRLLDFGIAKLLVEGEAQETELTRAGGQLLTPEYASPEQLAGLSVNKTSDVFSLGLVLFELLTGERAKKHTRDGVPVRPSEAVAGTASGPAPWGSAASGASAHEANAHARGMDRKHLAAMLKGDLDTIVLRALLNTPAERYPTPGELARDIERYLEGVPVLATLPTGSYRARKFVRRNRKAVIVAASVALALGFALGFAWRESARARRAEVVSASAPASSRPPGRPAAALQDGWVGMLSPGAASVSASGPSEGLHVVRVRGADLEHQDFINESTHGYYDAIGSYRRPLNYDVASNGFRTVRIEADVRIHGPLSPPHNFFAGSIGALGATVVDADGNPAGVDGVGELAISSDGHVYGYCGCHLVPTFQVSAPITLEAYHKLAIDVDFLHRTYTFFVDGALFGKPFPFPNDVKSNVLARSSLIAYAAPDTPTLSKRNYVVYYNNFSITNR